MAHEQSTRQETDSIECGIDLGTTNSLCAWVTRIDPQSASQALFDFQFAQHRLDRRITPSVVSVDATSGEILVGLDAVENESDNPDNTVHSIKRLMGRRFDEEEVSKLRDHVRYQIDRDEAGMAVVIFGGKTYTPTQISALILSRIKADAETHFGKKITHAVVSVPAYFDNNQINATREAARQAGFFVKRIVSEPVAASYAYGHGLVKGKKEKILVFDMGGGTFDVTVIRSAEPLSEVMAHEGDMWLGGDDIDSDLVKAKRNEIKEQFGVDPAVDPAFMVELAREVRRAKEAICSSERQSEVLRLPRPIEVLGDAATARSVNVKGMAVTRAEVALAARPLVNRAMELVDRALAKASLTVRKIDRVILVGGGAALLGVGDELRLKFPPDLIAMPQDPMAAVALGCGILARKIIGIECPNGHVNDRLAVVCATPDCKERLEPFVDRTPFSYGIEVEGGSVEKVLPKNTTCPTPAPITKTFLTAQPNQVKIYIPVYQGEETYTELNRLQGYVIVQLPSPKPINTPVEVRMSLNRDRLLEIEVVCEGYKEQAVLKSGDWSTSLQKEIDRARRLNQEWEVLAEGESIIKDFQKSSPNSEMEQYVAKRGRELLIKLRSFQWERLLRGPVDFLLTLSGEAEKRLPYIELLDHYLQTRVRGALEQYRVFTANQAGGDEVSVERAVWDAINALFRDPKGDALSLIHLRGDKYSPNPDQVALAKDGDELEMLLLQYQDAKKGGDEAVIREGLNKAQALFASIMNREHFKRALKDWNTPKKDNQSPLLKAVPKYTPDNDTWTMKNRR